MDAEATVAAAKSHVSTENALAGVSAGVSDRQSMNGCKED